MSILCLSACTKVELGSHIIKKIDPSAYATHKGSFKVGNPYKVRGQRYKPFETYNYTQTGVASWYGPDFHAKLTANGEMYNQNDLTAAHKTLQLPSIVRVTNLENGKSVIVRVNDRGPFARGRIIDMSSKAAELLDMKRQGTAKVKVEVLGEESREVARMAKAGQPTRGMEIAYNKGVHPHYQTASLTPEYIQKAPKLTTQPAPYAQKSGSAYSPNGPITVSKASSYITKPVQAEKLVKTYNVAPSNLYVQTASFSDSANAHRFADGLKRYGQTKIKEININGRNYYRVKLGPLNDVAHADSMLSTLIAAGYKDALIVVDTLG
jgi:rare lipoprotein A|tara:strand:+ start:84980 stop:85948 length:969 start_codon:yes stop_codon:yes gene_type:complete